MRIPILRLGRLLLTSIQSDLTDDHAIGLQTDILTLLQEDKADGVVLDITGLDIVDSYMARILNDTARMARIMGADVVMTGMQPMVALTLVEMGREIIGIDAALDLEAGVAKLRSSIGKRVPGMDSARSGSGSCHEA
jgi:rsbT antagonist protein RsbS